MYVNGLQIHAKDLHVQCDYYKFFANWPLAFNKHYKIIKMTTICCLCDDSLKTCMRIMCWKTIVNFHDFYLDIKICRKFCWATLIGEVPLQQTGKTHTLQCFCQSVPLQESCITIRDGHQKNEKRANLALSFYRTAGLTQA